MQGLVYQHALLGVFAGRGPLTTLLMAELDSLVDEMSYEELYEVFGGELAFGLYGLCLVLSLVVVLVDRSGWIA